MVHLRAVGDDDKREPGRPAAPEFDPWDVDKGHEYEVEQFYTRSTNKFDHSRDFRAAIPSPIHAQIQSLVENKKFPAYKSIADFARDAIVHRLRTVYGWVSDEELLAVLTNEERICKQDTEEAELDEIEKLLDKYAQQLERHTKTQDIRRLTNKLGEVEDWAYFLVPPHRDQAIELARHYRGQLKMLVSRAETE